MEIKNSLNKKITCNRYIIFILYININTNYQLKLNNKQYVKLYIKLYSKLYVKLYIKLYSKLYVKLYIKLYSKLYIKLNHNYYV